METRIGYRGKLSDTNVYHRQNRRKRSVIQSRCSIHDACGRKCMLPCLGSRNMPSLNVRRILPSRYHHVLDGYTTDTNDKSSTIIVFEARNKHFSGPWNNVIPCYVVDTQATSANIKLHEDPRKQIQEEQAVRAFEEKYKQYMENDADFGRAVSTNAKHARAMLHGFERMPAITPHVYSLLGASHELRIKQALAEGMARKRFVRSSMELNGLDENNSLSFHLDDVDYDVDDDALSRATTNLSTRNWVTRSTRSPSRRSTIGSSFKLDHGITMLKSKRRKNHDAVTVRDLVTIKPSFRAMKEAPSKTSSTKSPFYSMFGSRPSTNSILSATLCTEMASRRCGKCIYLNAPIKSVELRNKEYKVVPILVNYQLQALVQTVFEVLERVNPVKAKRIVDTARDTHRINKMLLRPEIQNFVQSLLGQSLVSSPESFVVSIASMADEIDLRFEGILERETIALTLEMPSLPALDALINEIRNNLFVDTKNETDGSKKEKNEASATVAVAVPGPGPGPGPGPDLGPGLGPGPGPGLGPGPGPAPAPAPDLSPAPDPGPDEQKDEKDKSVDCCLQAANVVDADKLV